jgi:hypothetical protein
LKKNTEPKVKGSKRSQKTPKVKGSKRSQKTPKVKGSKRSQKNKERIQMIMIIPSVPRTTTILLFVHPSVPPSLFDQFHPSVRTVPPKNMTWTV